MCSLAARSRRKVEWGFKIIGAFVGADEYVVISLRRKMDDFQRLTQALLLYPNAQARCCSHRFCFNAKIDYWMRAQYPVQATSFVDDFKEEQMKLVASYHGIYDANDFTRSRALISLTCSFAVSLKGLAKIFPNWIDFGRYGAVVWNSPWYDAYLCIFSSLFVYASYLFSVSRGVQSSAAAVTAQHAVRGVDFDDTWML